MKPLCVVVLCLLVGCLSQGVRGVYYVSVETEPLDENGDGIGDGITIFLVFRDRDLEPVSFSDAECVATVRVYGGNGLMCEKVVSFDSSALVGKEGGGIVIVGEEVQENYGDVKVVVTIEGRGEFRSEKKHVRLR